jgi:hypothetical protein
MAPHPRLGRVTKVRALVYRRGGNACYHANCDLIWVDEIPTVVVEWEVLPDGDLPLVSVPLDPTKLHIIGWDEAEYMYEEAIQDPRALD